MMKLINDVLMDFRSCFSRKAAFQWFVVIVAGLLVRTDHLGVTSIIRGLFLAPDYMGLIGFFRSGAWVLETLTAKWCALVKKYAPLVKQGDAVIIVGDGVKQAKEGRRMPGVKRQHQESEDSSKPEYMWGHLFGGVGILAGVAGKLFCLPLAMRIQGGVKAIFGLEQQPERQTSHVTEMIRLAYETARHFGKAILLLDRLFLTVPALLMLDTLNASGQILQIVTKAKRNCVAYYPPEVKEKRRGRPRKKGAAVKLFDLFELESERFLSAEVSLYGRLEKVRYHCVDLLWGQGLYKKLRFVLVEYNNMKTILVSTDFSLEPLDIIQLYSRRFSVETMFREMKQVICAFGYRFWSKYMPKLNRFRKKTDPDPLEQITSQRARKRIRLAVKATEGFMLCAVVATGLLQLISLRFSGSDELNNLRFMRTYRSAIVSEATTADFLRKNFFHLLLRQPDLGINQIISAKQPQTTGVSNLSNAS
jgi:hypothetical protein